MSDTVKHRDAYVVSLKPIVITLIFASFARFKSQK